MIEWKSNVRIKEMIPCTLVKQDMKKAIKIVRETKTEKYRTDKREKETKSKTSMSQPIGTDQ